MSGRDDAVYLYSRPTVCTLNGVLYTGAPAHCDSYVCVMQPTAVGGAHNSPVANATMHDIEELVSPHQVTFI